MGTKHRFKCRHCGKGYQASYWEKNGRTLTCKRAKCEKKQGIYEKPTITPPTLTVTAGMTNKELLATIMVLKATCIEGKEWEVTLNDRVIKLSYAEWLAIRKLQNTLFYTEP